MYLQPSLKSKTNQRAVKLTPIEIWWANLLPISVKKMMPHWMVSALAFTLIAVAIGTPLSVGMAAVFWASMIFALVFRQLSPFIGKYNFIIPGYHALMFAFISKPALAQAAGGVCTTTGLFSGVTNFVANTFNTFTLTGAGDGAGGAALSDLICQTVGLLTVGLLLGFLGVMGSIAYQVGYQRQPISTVLDPLFGFLIFAGGSFFVIKVMVGA